MNVNDATRGQLDSIILRTLLDKDEYGFEILNNIKLLDNVIGDIKQSTFYNALKRLENANLITSYNGEFSKGARRVYYSITAKGRLYLVDEYKQWNIGYDADDIIDGDAEDYYDEFDMPKTKRTRRKAIIADNNIVDENDESLLPDSHGQSEVADNVIDIENTDYNSHTDDNVSINENINDNDDINNKFDTQEATRYTSDIKINTVIAKVIPAKKTNEISKSTSVEADTVNNAVDAYDLLYNKILTVDKNNERIPDIGKFDIHVEEDNAESIAEKQALLDTLVGIDFTEYEKREEDVVKQSPSNLKVELHSSTDIDLIESENRSETHVEPLMSEIMNCEPAYNKTQDSNRNEPSRKEILSKPYSSDYQNSGSSVDSDVAKYNYIDTLSDIYSNFDEKDESSVVKESPDVMRSTLLNYDDYDKDKFNETSFNKLKQKLNLEGIKLKQYVKSNTTSFYLGKYYYSNKLLRDTSVIAYLIFLIFCVASHITAAALKSSNLAVMLSTVFIAALVPITTMVNCYKMPTKRKRLPLNFSFMMIASLLIYLISVVIIVLIAFFGFKVNVSEPITLIVPLVMPIVISAIIPLSVLIYGLLFNSKRYHLK